MAFWFKPKDSSSRAVVLRLLGLAALMAGYLFTPCYCIPIGSGTEATLDEPWWCQPCKSEHKTRHSRGIRNELRDTFAIAIGTYENTISQYVKQLHNKLQIGNITKKQFKKNNWLPRKKFFKKLRKDDDKILPELHYQVQIYAVTIQRLLNMEIRTQDNSFDVAQRTHILGIVKAHLNLLRCDIEEEIAEKQMEAPARVPENFVDKKIPKSVDHLADGLIKDYSILKDYYNFLKKCSSKIFGNERRRRKTVTKGEQKQEAGVKRTKNGANQKSARS